MSQFPRPRYQTTLPSGESVGVQAAGIPDPVMGSDPASRQLQGALGDLTQAVGIAGNIAVRNQNEKERSDYRAKVDAEKADNLQWGAISRAISTDVRERLPGDIDSIRKGTFGWEPSDKGDPEIRMQRLAEEATIDVPEQFRDRAIDQFKSQWSTRGLGAMYAKSQADQKQAKTTAVEGVTNEVMLLTDPAKISESVAKAKGTIPGFTDADADEVIVDAMLNTAKLGTPESAKMVEGFKSFLGKREVAARDQADRMVEAGKQKDEAERTKQFANEAATIRDRAFDKQTSPERVKAEIKKAGEALGIEARFIESQVNELNTAIARQRDEQIKRQVYESIANSVAADNFATVNTIFSNAGDATTPQTGLIKGIDFQSIPGLPEELGGEKVRRANFISEARRQTQVNLANTDTEDGVNVNQWTRYVRGMAGTRVKDDYIENTLTSLDFGTTDKEGEQVNNPQNELAIRTYIISASINKNWTDSMVTDPQARKVYDSVGIDMLTPGFKLSPQIIRDAIAKGRVKPQDEAGVSSKDYDAVLKANPNLSPELARFAARIYSQQKNKPGALEYASKEANARGVQLWQSWAGWANWAVPFTRANNSPTRPMVDLGTLADVDPSIRPAIGTAMESLLKDKAADISKLDPTDKYEADDLGLNYIGKGVWEVDGLVAGRLDAKHEHLFYVTDAQVREQVQKNADTQKVESLADLEKQLAEAKRYQREVESAARTGDPVNPTKLLPNGGMMMNGYQNGDGLVSIIETKIKVRKLQESKKKP